MMIEASWKFLELSRNVITSMVCQDKAEKLSFIAMAASPHPAVLIPVKCSCYLKGVSLWFDFR